MLKKIKILFLFLLFLLSFGYIFCEEYYTVTFLYNETKKVVSVKAGEIVPASEIPEIEVKKGQAVWWRLENYQPFIFTNGIIENVELFPHIVNINIESVPAVIRTRYGDTVHDIKLTGLIKEHEYLVQKIGNALDSLWGTNYMAKVKLDMGDTLGLSYIKNSAFNNKKALVEIILPKEGLTEIGEDSFRNLTYLENIVISDTVKKIGKSAFQDCINLKTVTYLGSEDSWKNINIDSGNECLLNAEIKFIEEAKGPVEIFVKTNEAADTILTLIGKNKIVVTGECSNIDIIKIGQAIKNSPAALIYLDLTETTGLTEIPANTFNNCQNLAFITFPSTLEKINDNAFTWCVSLQSVTIPASVTKISSRSFSRCDCLTTVVFENTENWFATENSEYTDGKQKDVLNDHTNAMNLRNSNYNMYRKTSDE